MLILIAQNLAMGAGTTAPTGPLVVYVDPRAVQRVANSSDTDPFGVDPRAVQVVQ